MDAFAVAIATGIALGEVSGRQLFRLSWHFGLFQFLMPVVGWMAGVTLAARLSAWDHWLAFGLLLFIGGKMIRSGIRGADAEAGNRDPTRGVSLVLLSVATSVDALAVGLSLGVLGVRIWYPAAVIGVVTCGLTAAGMRLGRVLGRAVGNRMEVAGGLVLVGIGVKILAEHLGG